MGQWVSRHSLTNRSPSPIPAQSATADNAQSLAECSFCNRTVKPDPTTIVRRRPSSAAAIRAATTAIRAIDERNIRKLKRALQRYGCRGWSELMRQYDSLSSLAGGPPSSLTSANTAALVTSYTAHTDQHQHPATSSLTSSNSLPTQYTPRSPSLLEYAVEKNFVAGVELLLQAMSTSDVTEYDKVRSVTSAFMKTCDNGYLRLTVFNMFIEAAIDGRIQLDLHAAYAQLVDHYMYRKPFDLVRKQFFDLSTLPDSLCRITPLGLAVIHDDPFAIEEFARRGANLDGYDREGNTALLRAGYGMKRACFRTILLLGADPNRRSYRSRFSTSGSSTFPYTTTTSPLIAVCMAFGHCMRTRSNLIATLVACGLNPSVDRAWFAVALGFQSPVGNSLSVLGLLPGVNTTALHNCLVRRLEEPTRKTIIELCSRPPTLETQCCRAVRQQLARAKPGDVSQKIELLTLPPAIKAKLKLENIER